MKIYFVTACILLFAACSPKPQNNSTTCFKGKLVKRGICGQRVVQLMGDANESVLMATAWTDSLSGKNYTHVFTVANACDFPSAIKEGETFDFSITTNPSTDCITCYAYTPVPAEKNRILTGCTP